MSIMSFFCRHKWTTRSKDKKIFETLERTVLNGYQPMGDTREMTVEILVCEKCGEIKKMVY